LIAVLKRIFRSSFELVSDIENAHRKAFPETKNGKKPTKPLLRIIIITQPTYLANGWHPGRAILHFSGTLKGRHITQNGAKTPPFSL
jgi:hypothetical protein